MFTETYFGSNEIEIGGKSRNRLKTTVVEKVV